jgi:hypothetical protein
MKSINGTTGYRAHDRFGFVLERATLSVGDLVVQRFGAEHTVCLFGNEARKPLLQ